MIDPRSNPRPSCAVCHNWREYCLCPLWNDATNLRLLAVTPGPVAIAAIRKGDTIYGVRRPARHCHVFAMMKYTHGLHTGEADEVQGFVTSGGDFVDRDEALVMARAAGQVTGIIGSVLTSEDMW